MKKKTIKNTTNFALATFPYDDFFVLTALLIVVRLNFSDAPRDQDNLLKLLSTLSAIAAPSAGTLQNFCTFFVRGAELGAAMAESAVRNSLTRARQASLLATLPALRITYQSCSPRSPLSPPLAPATLPKMCKNFEGCRR